MMLDDQWLSQQTAQYQRSESRPGHVDHIGIAHQARKFTQARLPDHPKWQGGVSRSVGRSLSCQRHLHGIGLS